MSVNKVVYNGKTLVDMTGATATAAQILSGYTAYGKNGAIMSGTANSDRLNFRIFGGETAPSSPKWNDIWAKTSLAIPNGSVFFNEYVSTFWLGVSNGGLYIPMVASNSGLTSSTGMNCVVGTGYLAEFNVNLIGCQQKVDGKWVGRNAYIYHNGWVQFATAEYYITYAGGTANYTGGWTGLGNVTTIGSDIQCYVDYSWAGCQAFTNGSFDVTNYSKLYVNISSVTALRDQASFGLNARKPNSVMWNDSFTNKNNCAVIQSITSAGTKMIDISSLSGNYHFWCGQNGTGWAGKSGFTIDKIWLA